MRFRTRLIGAATAAASLTLAASGPASAQLQTATDFDVTPTQQVTSTDVVKPVRGDFDGDGRLDIFWYRAGTAADVLWSGKSNQNDIVLDQGDTRVAVDPLADRFEVDTTLSISGTYSPFTGDFDGNGIDDIFWYGPGKAPDSIWYFTARGTLISVTTQINGTYTPIVGNFDSVDALDVTEQDDIFWYDPTGAAFSSLWSGNTNRTFSGAGYATKPPASAKVLKGNFRQSSTETSNEQENLDLYFYGPGTRADSLWVGSASGAFTPTALPVNGTYTPLVGNFDGRASGIALTDVFWYAPGKAADSVWMNTGSAFTSTAVTVNSTYAPFVLRGEDNGLETSVNDTIIWNRAVGSDYAWDTRGTNGTFDYLSYELPDMGGLTPLGGDYDGNLVAMGEGPTSDILWYARGNLTGQVEKMWLNVDFGPGVITG